MQAAICVDIDGRRRWVRARWWVAELVGNEWALYVGEGLASCHSLPCIYGDVKAQEERVHVDIRGHSRPAVAFVRDSKIV